MPRRTRSSSGGATANSTDPKRARTELGRFDRSVRDAMLGLLGGEMSGRRRMVTVEEERASTRALRSLGSQEQQQEKEVELKVKSLDLLISENRKAHHTDEYEHECLIVRRGQAFDMALTFNREFNPTIDTVTLQISTGSRPKESKGTLIRFVAGEAKRDQYNVWHAKVTNHEGAVVTVTITPSTEAIIGDYHLYVETCSTDEDGLKHQVRREFDDRIIVLFNPFCIDDDVSMQDEAERHEYVMNESGRLWQGSRRNPGAGTPWNFGQFEDVCLEAALYLLDKAELSDGARSNPVQVVRTMVAMANSCDDNGVLEGRWTDTYPKNCTVPWVWTGSVAILEQFMKKKKTVKYGQCWVFSGVITTLLRALGIPTRSVTNFESAHDCDGSMTLDYHWGEDDEPLEHLNNDSIWNFHVWNECWFRRPDLPSGYSGWQACDATPQEASEGVMRCGPSPLAAIKLGIAYLPYDTPFIFAEVNGDKVHWLEHADGSMEPIHIEHSVIGAKISTKAVGSNRRHDITHLYKFPEGSQDERKAMEKAFRFSTRGHHNIYQVPEPDVKFALDTPEECAIGKPFELKVTMTNQTEEERNVTARVTAVMSFYTGVTSEQVKTESLSEVLPPNGEVTRTVEVSAEEYKDFLKPEASIMVYLKGTVKDTKRSYAHSESFNLIKPDISLKVEPDRVCKGEEFTLSMSMTNPLQDKLTNASFHVEAPGMARDIVIPHRKAIASGEEITETVTLTPKKSGTKDIVVRFSSDQLTGLSGTTEIYVKFGE